MTIPVDVMAHVVGIAGQQPLKRGSFAFVKTIDIDPPASGAIPVV